MSETLETSTARGADWLYHALGQRAGIRAIVDGLYDRIGEDERVNGFFGETGMPRDGMEEYLVHNTGGPAKEGYEPPADLRFHQEFGITDEHFGIVAGHANTAMAERPEPFGPVDPDIAAATMGFLASKYGEVVAPPPAQAA
jgi:truncated hemoglobin YjbI